MIRKVVRFTVRTGLKKHCFFLSSLIREKRDYINRTGLIEWRRGNLGIRKFHDTPFAFPTSVGGKRRREKLITILILIYHERRREKILKLGMNNVRYKFSRGITFPEKINVILFFSNFWFCWCFSPSRKSEQIPS